MNEKIITCVDVVKIYSSSLDSKIKVSALKGIDCEIFSNDLIAIIGPSGSGKTTLLNILSFFDYPSSGKVEYSFEGGNIKQNDPELKFQNLRKNFIGFLFQDPKQNLFFNLNVFENIILPMKIAKKYSQNEENKRVDQLLSFFGIQKLKKSMPHMLSGGEAQKVAFCIALSNDPSILFLDEPTGELDKRNKELILKYINKVHQELKKTIIIVSHDQELYKDFKKIFFLKNGKIETFSISNQQSYKFNQMTMSNNGELIFSFYYLQKLGIKETAIVEIVNNNLRIRSGNLNRELLPNQDIVLVKDNGLIIIPKNIREEFKTNDFTLVPSENFLELRPND